MVRILNEKEMLLKERKRIIEETTSNKKSDRVPVVSLCTTWAYWYYGKKPLDSFTDPDLNKQVFRKLYQDFYWDGILLPRNGKSFSQRTIDLLGGGTYTYDRNGMQQTKPGSVTVMEPDEYPELIEDPYKFVLEKVFPRRYELMRRTDDKKYEDMVEVMKDAIGMAKQFSEEDRIAEEEFGIAQMRTLAFYSPIDYVLDYMRDFDVIMGDVKRRSKLVNEAGMALIDFAFDNIGNVMPEEGKVIFMPMHLPQFLNKKDFEKVYWPSYTALLNKIISKGFKVVCYFERSYEHLFEYLKELPKNKIVGLFENDDIIMAKKRLGDTMCVAGGMPVSLLQSGTKQACIDHVKRVIDEAGRDGGYMFTTDMIMLTDSDGKAENLHAVNEFVHEYGVLR